MIRVNKILIQRPWPLDLDILVSECNSSLSAMYILLNQFELEIDLWQYQVLLGQNHLSIVMILEIAKTLQLLLWVIFSLQRKVW